MTRGWAVVLGIGLIILGLAGLDPAAGRAWMAWLDFVGAFFSFVIAGAVTPDVRTTRTAVTSGPVALSIGLFVMAVIGFASGSVAGWVCWWNIGFACAYMVVGIAASARAEAPRGRRTAGPVVPRESMTSRVERDEHRHRGGRAA